MALKYVPVEICPYCKKVLSIDAWGEHCNWCRQQIENNKLKDKLEVIFAKIQERYDNNLKKAKMLQDAWNNLSWWQRWFGPAPFPPPPEVPTNPYSPTYYDPWQYYEMIIENNKFIKWKLCK